MRNVLMAYIEMLLNAPQISDQLDELKTGISDSGELDPRAVPDLGDAGHWREGATAMIMGTQETTASIDEMETTLDAQLAHSTRLRQSVLKRAFEGGWCNGNRSWQKRKEGCTSNLGSQVEGLSAPLVHRLERGSTLARVPGPRHELLRGHSRPFSCPMMKMKVSYIGSSGYI
ncbi:MAG: hypothetical protein IPL86_16295 [Flavobacteriales bacterium]|nr:hypothetical protein [Flavobacteriales bacterium]